MLFITLVTTVSAQNGSGACSWHNGVNCSIGRQADGSVYCNDGWKDSMVEYDFVQKCNEIYNPMKEAMKAQKYVMSKKDIPDWDTKSVNCMKDMYKDLLYIERVKRCSTDVSAKTNQAIYIPNCPSNSYIVSNGKKVSNYFCRCDDGYYNYENDTGYGSQGYCSRGDPPTNTMDALREMRRSIQSLTYVEPIVPELNTNSDKDYASSKPQTTTIDCANEFIYSDVLKKCQPAEDYCIDNFGKFSTWKSNDNGGEYCSCIEGYDSVGKNTCTSTPNQKPEYAPTADVCGYSNGIETVWTGEFDIQGSFMCDCLDDDFVWKETLGCIPVTDGKETKDFRWYFIFVIAVATVIIISIKTTKGIEE